MNVTRDFWSNERSARAAGRPCGFFAESQAPGPRIQHGSSENHFEKKSSVYVSELSDSCIYLRMQYTNHLKTVRELRNSFSFLHSCPQSGILDRARLFVYSTMDTSRRRPFLECSPSVSDRREPSKNSQTNGSRQIGSFPTSTYRCN